MIFVKIPHMGDNSIATAGYDDGTWFTADSFSFGVDRELKDSGEKGGTADINIGIGEPRECTLAKRLDLASPQLAQFAVNGNSMGTVEIDFVEFGGGSAPPTAYLKFKLDRCFVKSWSMTGDAEDQPTEVFSLHYNRIAFQCAQPKDETAFDVSKAMSWDLTRNTPWSSHGIELDVKTGDTGTPR